MNEISPLGSGEDIFKKGPERHAALAPEQEGYYHCWCTNIGYHTMTDCEAAGYKWECDSTDD